MSVARFPIVAPSRRRRGVPQGLRATFSRTDLLHSSVPIPINPGLFGGLTSIPPPLHLRSLQSLQSRDPIKPYYLLFCCWQLVGGWEGGSWLTLSDGLTVGGWLVDSRLVGGWLADADCLSAVGWRLAVADGYPISRPSPHRPGRFLCPTLYALRSTTPACRVAASCSPALLLSCSSRVRVFVGLWECLWDRAGAGARARVFMGPCWCWCSSPARRRERIASRWPLLVCVRKREYERERAVMRNA